MLKREGTALCNFTKKRPGLFDSQNKKIKIVLKIPMDRPENKQEFPNAS